MKKLAILLVLFASPVFAKKVTLETMSKCENFNSYKETGWVIHKPASFNRLYDLQQKIIDNGLENQTIIQDLSGTTRTFNTRGGRPILMAVETYDALRTSQDLMYGDHAVMVNHFKNEEVLEARWFDGKRKHVVINPVFMSCISTTAPGAINTIF